jgi:hypothetical protein
MAGTPVELTGRLTPVQVPKQVKSISYQSGSPTGEVGVTKGSQTRARLIIDTGDIFAMRLSQHVWRKAGRLNLHEPNYASGVDDGHGKRARAHVAGRSKQWINRSKSAGMNRAAAALSREHASPLRAAGRRAIVRSSTCRTWVPASRWKVPSEFPIHSILRFTTHPSAVAA